MLQALLRSGIHEPRSILLRARRPTITASHSEHPLWYDEMYVQNSTVTHYSSLLIVINNIIRQEGIRLVHIAEAIGMYIRKSNLPIQRKYIQPLDLSWSST